MKQERPLRTLAQGRPFPHVLIDEVLNNSQCLILCRYLERLQWKKSQSRFYGFDVAPKGHLLEMLLPDSIISAIIRATLRLPRISRGGKVRISAHRYRPGDGIGPHTDAGVHAYRFILNLNRGWSPEDGGMWLLSDNARLTEPVLIAPKNNSGFGFATGPRTFHALAERSASEAYSVIFEFALGRTR